MTTERLNSEFQLLCRRYGEMEHGENLDWVMFREFPLPPGWNVDKTELLVVIPPGYPNTPPDNFFVRNGLCTSNGNGPENYSENQTVLGASWAQFSFHVKEWNPNENSDDGDSLLTFMLAVERRLQENN